ncbi:hypothetical protein BUALT_Bualt04G0046100 [Buddleja alternifolia]|uniref:Uncharacterized protein n=1 Tax=Buddleja alternifolia TaxID=168488 RepID=A0AAV6XMQ0_9LAMI|nr:hypothetical protein BUALT_Bualt04G0046100 [Buddleja alternifolia]
MDSSLNRRHPKQELELRYLSTPLCECKMQADIRVVESDRKPSKGNCTTVALNIPATSLDGVSLFELHGIQLAHQLFFHPILMVKVNFLDLKRMEKKWKR